MTTARDALQDTLEKIGSYAPGETLTDADAERGLAVLNRMMDSWSNEALTCFAIKEQSFPLVPNQLQYTIGPGGDFNGVRPLRILDGPGTCFVQDSEFNRYPVSVVPQDKWNMLWNLQRVTSNLPDTLFYDPQFPLGIIRLYPLYNGGLSLTLFFDSYLQLGEFADLTTDYKFPVGYEAAIFSALAPELWPYFKTDGSEPSKLIMRQAAIAKGNIKRTNTRLNIAVFEKELSARGGANFNIYSDSYR